MTDRSNASEVSHPMTDEAYKFWSTPLKGVELRRFVTFESMKKVSAALGRPLSLDEVELIVNFERDDQNEPLMAKCAVTGATFPAVCWVVPTQEFCRLVEELGDIREAGETLDLHVFGSFYMNEKEPLKEPIAVSGAPCPGYVKKENRFQQSCLRDIMERTGKRHLGIPRYMVLAIQQDIRDAEERKQDGISDSRRKQEEEARQAREKERLEKIDNLLNDFNIGGTTASETNEAEDVSPNGHDDTYVAPVRQAKHPVGRGVKRTAKREPQPELQST